MLEIKPIGTVPPSASWTSRAVKKQTAEKWSHLAAPRAAALAGSHNSRHDMPLPTLHVLHGAQVDRPTVAVNEPAVHITQIRLLPAVGATVMCVPGAQSRLTVVHASPELLSENVLPG